MHYMQRAESSLIPESPCRVDFASLQYSVNQRKGKEKEVIKRGREKEEEHNKRK